MSRRHYRILTLALGLAFAQVSHAAVFFEPMVGYAIGNSRFESHPDYEDADAGFNGPSFGARAGATFGKTKAFFFAADFKYSMLGYEEGERATNMAVAGLLGVRLKKFSLWGGAVPLNTFELKDQGLKFNGLGLKAGLGFMIKRFSLNVEYALNPTSELCEDGNCQDVPASATVDNNTIFMSISLPITFGRGRGGR